MITLATSPTGRTLYEVCAPDGGVLSRHYTQAAAVAWEAAQRRTDRATPASLDGSLDSIAAEMRRLSKEPTP